MMLFSAFLFFLLLIFPFHSSFEPNQKLASDYYYDDYQRTKKRKKRERRGKANEVCEAREE
jgi:hypothetical protein